MENSPPSPAEHPFDERSEASARASPERNTTREERPRPDPERPVAIGEPQPIDVLAVDDDPRNLEVTRALLSRSGARIVEASTAEEALRILLTREVALILLDVNLPGMSGLEMAKLVRARERTRHTPIIFLTASSDVRLLERGYALGAVDFLTTPVPEQALRAKVAFFIEAHRKNEVLRRNSELLRAAHERELARNVAEARRRWEEEALRREMERDRRLVETLHKANERLKILSGVRSDLLSTENVRERLPAICERVATQLGLERWAVHVAGPDGRLSLVAAGGAQDDAAERVASLDSAEAILGGLAPWVSGRGEPLPPVAAALGAACCVARPCLAGGKVIATLAFGSAERDACDPDDPATLELVGYAIAMALDRDRLIAELQGRNAELREADHRKDQFLAMLAHELRNPLAPVSNAVRLLQEYGADARVRERALQAAGRQVRHMARLVDDLLDVSRIRSGKVRLRKDVVDLVQVVRDAVQTMQELVMSRRHALGVSLPDGPLLVEGDTVRLAQVVENLVANAAKYTDPGGHLRVALARAGDEAVLSVQDDGIGIAPELATGIFEPFVQAEQGMDRSRGGLGIGLSLVKSLVEMHGGRVGVESPGPARGSTFTVRLPALAADTAVPTPARPTSPAPPAAEPTAPRDILIVEDIADIRETLGELLRRRGHGVREADGGRAALELARAAPPEIALVDIGLPEIDGYEVAQRLREIAPATRLVALTGYGGAEDRRRASEAGFRAHLVKPIDIDDLIALIDTLD
ncbi:response regulator [Anaeromyxobacter terrae]|uniref:response regulator n=1 Tax=Anaeromyxobacter terrae TaxID=2925406 RepID=UPI001F58730B|nr:response regulator [Anaeromyxobacter sp. SG22]